MADRTDFDALLANNPGVDAGRLEEYRRSAELFRQSGSRGGRYKYNLIPPFAGRSGRHPAAEAGGPNDNVREPNGT